MSKQRKRTNKNVPAKGRLRDMCDRLWSVAVRDDWNNRCAACGHPNVEAHHLIPRQHQTTRYDLRNGIALCANHHQFDKDTSPHQNAAGFLLWLEKRWAYHHYWYVDNMKNGVPQFDGITNAAYYCGEIWRLKEYVPDEQYRKIVGVRFGAWLDDFPRF